MKPGRGLTSLPSFSGAGSKGLAPFIFARGEK